MINKLVEIWFMFVFGGMFWLFGFLSQKVRNSANSKDYSFRSSVLWTWLFGVRPEKERVYLRPAYVQVLGLVYLIAGSLAVWFLDARFVRNVSLTFLVTGLFAGGAFWLIMDWITRRKHRCNK